MMVIVGLYPSQDATVRQKFLLQVSFTEPDLAESSYFFNSNGKRGGENVLQETSHTLFNRSLIRRTANGQ